MLTVRSFRPTLEGLSNFVLLATDRLSVAACHVVKVFLISSTVCDTVENAIRLPVIVLLDRSRTSETLDVRIGKASPMMVQKTDRATFHLLQLKLLPCICSQMMFALEASTQRLSL